MRTDRNTKVKTVEALAETLRAFRHENQGAQIVHCHGVFDLLHIGHIRHLEQAKKSGDILLVTLTPDHYVNKGPNRPAFPEALRAEAIAALDCVDYVAINEWPTAVETIGLLRPDFYVKGSDYNDAAKDLTGKITDEEAAVVSVGGKIIFTDDIVYSSSSLINQYLPTFPKEVNDYLAGFSARYSSDDVIRYLEKARSFKVLIVGETIIDEYQYCEQIGKSTKDPILATRYVSTEKFAGGTVAIANNVSNFCDDVCLVTMLGAQNAQEAFIDQSINRSVKTKFLYKTDSPTIVKRRFVESYLLQKLFEVYEINDEELQGSQNEELCDWLEKMAPKYDIVIVADYGHGMMTKEAIDAVGRRSQFLSVNTQSNAGNRGFNTVSRYHHADYVCLATHELALEERSRRQEVRDMVLNVSRNMSCERMVVTLGKDGNLCYSKEEGFFEVPAFAQQVVDRMGAGDSVLALTTLLVAQDAPMETVGFLANVVGAEAVATLGHRDSIEKLRLYRHIESLLK